MPGRRSLPIVGQPQPERADAARNRQKIIEVATRMIAERGAEELSLDEVARVAGVGVGTVYRRFGDRSTLIFALLDDWERQFQAAFLTGPPPLGPGAPADERIVAFLHALVDRIVAQQGLFLLLETGGKAPLLGGRTGCITCTWPRCSGRRARGPTPPTWPTPSSRRSTPA
ncbi:TetR/AcrR family transcriptional regulator [Nonomuraea antimicrobica]